MFPGGPPRLCSLFIEAEAKDDCSPVFFKKRSGKEESVQ